MDSDTDGERGVRELHVPGSLDVPAESSDPEGSDAGLGDAYPDTRTRPPASIPDTTSAGDVYDAPESPYDAEAPDDPSDEWVTFVRAQLALLFPDLSGVPRDASPPPPTGDLDVGGRPVSFREELGALRSEITMLRGVVGELTGEMRGGGGGGRGVDLGENGGDGVGAEDGDERKEQVCSVADEVKHDAPSGSNDTTASGQHGQVVSYSPDASANPTDAAAAATGLPGPTLSAALDLVRALDAARFGPRADADVFAADNLAYLTTMLGPPLEVIYTPGAMV